MNHYNLKNLNELYNFMSASVVTPLQTKKMNLYLFDIAVYPSSYDIGVFDSLDEINIYIEKVLGREFPVRFKKDNEEILYKKGNKQIFFGNTRLEINKGYDYIIEEIMETE